MNVRTVDAHIYGGGENLERIEQQAAEVLAYFVAYCHHHGLAAKGYLAFGTDPIEEGADDHLVIIGAGGGHAGGLCSTSSAVQDTVLMRVRASSLNYRDLMVLKGGGRSASCRFPMAPARSLPWAMG